jgi:hypothetical protein
MTGQELVESALRLIGVVGEGETPNSEQATNALESLNMIIESWYNEGLAAYISYQESFTITANVGSYTIGPSATWNTVRPVAINKVMVRDSSGTDYPVELINSSQYWDIASKAVTSSLPRYAFYYATETTGTVYLWPVPTQSLTAKVNTRKQLGTITLSAALTLPPGYNRALKYALALDLADEYRIAPLPHWRTAADEAKNALMATNNPRDEMGFDDALLCNQGVYDIYSDG